MNDIWIIHLIDLIDGQMPQFNKRQFETGAFVENATLMHECIRDAVNRLEGMILKEIPHDRLTMFLLGVVSDFLLEFADYIPTSMEDIKWFRYGNEDEDDDMWYHWGIEEFVTAINKLIIKFNIPEDDNIKTLYERTWFVKDFTYEKKWMKENMSIDAVNRFKNLGVLPFLCDDEQAPEGNSSTPEPQQKDLEYYCQKAVEKGYLKKVDGGYRRLTITKAQLADLLNHFILPTGKFDDKGWSLLFGESRLSKAADQLKNNRNGRCSHYEIIDALLKE